MLKVCIAAEVHDKNYLPKHLSGSYDYVSRVASQADIIWRIQKIIGHFLQNNMNTKCSTYVNAC